MLALTWNTDTGIVSFQIFTRTQAQARQTRGESQLQVILAQGSPVVAYQLDAGINVGIVIRDPQNLKAGCLAGPTVLARGADAAAGYTGETSTDTTFTRGLMHVADDDAAAESMSYQACAVLYYVPAGGGEPIESLPFPWTVLANYYRPLQPPADVIETYPTVEALHDAGLFTTGTLDNARLPTGISLDSLSAYNFTNPNNGDFTVNFTQNDRGFLEADGTQTLAWTYSNVTMFGNQVFNSDGSFYTNEAGGWDGSGNIFWNTLALANSYGNAYALTINGGINVQGEPYGDGFFLVTPDNGQVKIGDVGFDYNNTNITLDDQACTIGLTALSGVNITGNTSLSGRLNVINNTVYRDGFLIIDPQNYVIKIGDWAVDNGGTSIVIDDSANNIFLSGNVYADNNLTVDGAVQAETFSVGQYDIDYYGNAHFNNLTIDGDTGGSQWEINGSGQAVFQSIQSTGTIFANGDLMLLGGLYSNGISDQVSVSAPILLSNYSRLVETATQPSTVTGRATFWVRSSDHKLCIVDSTGTNHALW